MNPAEMLKCREWKNEVDNHECLRANIPKMEIGAASIYRIIIEDD